jgi:hypothetical protein
VVDRLVDRDTRLQPDQRPTMPEIAADLVAWRELGKTSTIDVSELAVALRAKMEREIADEDLLEQRRELAHAAVRRLQELCRPLNDALRAAHPRPQLDIIGDRYARNVLHTPRHSGAPEIVFSYDRVSKIGSGDEVLRFELSCGSGVDLTADGTLVFRAFVLIGREAIGGSRLLVGERAAGSARRQRRVRQDARGRRGRTGRAPTGRSARLCDRATGAGALGGRRLAADQAVHGPVPLVEDLHRLVSVTREVDAAHIVGLVER